MAGCPSPNLQLYMFLFSSLFTTLQVPVEKDLEFPCEKTTLYDTFNPFHVNKSLSPPPTKGKACDNYDLEINRINF